ATTSLAPLPPRSARTSFGLVSTKGFVASMSTRPFQAGRLFNADSTFRHGTASNTYSRLAASSTEPADAPRPSSADLSTRASGPRRLLKTTSWPLASASRPNASATAPAPIVPNFILPSYRLNIDEDDARPAGSTDVRARAPLSVTAQTVRRLRTALAFARTAARERHRLFAGGVVVAANRPAPRL